MGGNMWECFPPFSTDPKLIEFGTRRYTEEDALLEERIMFERSDNSIAGRHAEVSRSSKALRTTFWTLQLMLAAVFFVAGTMKLASPQVEIGFFEKIGFGQWFRYCTGALEVTCAILVLIPRTAGVAAALLAMTMVGAVEVHLAITGGSPVFAIVLLVLAVGVTWYHELYLPWHQ
jgi:putative oxidoreductase